MSYIVEFNRIQFSVFKLKIENCLYLLGMRQKAFKAVIFVFERDRDFLCLVFDSSVARVKNWTQKVEIPQENKNDSLKCLLSHTSSLQSRYRQFSILGLNTLTWIRLNSTITQKRMDFSQFHLHLWSPNVLIADLFSWMSQPISSNLKWFYYYFSPRLAEQKRFWA